LSRPTHFFQVNHRTALSMVQSALANMARIQRLREKTLQFLLLCLSLLLFAPLLAQAHGAHHERGDDSRIEQMRAADVQVVDLAAAERPCGGGGDSPCYCDRPCGTSPDPTKLPAAAPVRLSAPTPMQHPLPVFVAYAPAWAPSPIIAFAAPRAPPLPL